MSSPVLENSAQTQNGNKVLIRKTADFHPPIWGDRFSNYVAEDKISSEQKEQRVKELKEEVKREIIATAVNPSQQLKLIDDIQRLGIGYHFEKEIQESLQVMYETYDDYQLNNLDDLYIVSLRFRLLRQQGFNISCDIFNKFKDDNEIFSETLIGDTLGLLSLYEASYLRTHGEDILDEALAFTSSHLQLMKTSHLSNPLASQSLHKKELSDLTRWWKNLDFATKLPFARDRIVELYFWILGLYIEPQYSLGRILTTKALAMVSYLDDVYDVHGTQEELVLFSDAIERWDVNSMDQLPEYMQFLFQAILDVYEEIGEEMVKEGRSHCVYYAKEVIKRLVNGYFQEAKWYNKDYVPTLEEYLRNGVFSSAYPLIALTSFLGVEGLKTNDAFHWIFNIPKILRTSAIIGRLLDDIVSHKFEQERGDVASAVECCVNEYGVSEQHAYGEIQKRLVNEWKDLNEECLKPTNQDIPMPLLMIVLNLTRVAEVFYKEGDGYTHVGKEMRDRITLLLIDNFPI